MPAVAKRNKSVHASNIFSNHFDRKACSDVSQIGQTNQEPFFSSNGKKGSFFQPKLTVNRVNDPFEVEADRVADEVTQSIYSGKKEGSIPPANPSLGKGNASISMKTFFQRKPAFESSTELDKNSASIADIQTKKNSTTADVIQRFPAFESPTELDKNSANKADIQTKRNNSIINTVQRIPAFENPPEMDFNTEFNDNIQSTIKNEKAVNSVPPPPPIQREEEDVEKAESDYMMPERIQDNSIDDHEVSSGFEQQLSSSKGGGAPLNGKTRNKMESAFGSDFSNVRIHNDSKAESMNSQVSAKAFTHGRDIYFNKGNYQPDNKEGTSLLAHELTHVVQQGGAPKTKVQQKASNTSIQRSAQVNVTHTAPPMVQRGVIQKARNYLAKKAKKISGYTMLTIAIGYNPIKGKKVKQSGKKIFNVIKGYLPKLIGKALNNLGIFAKVGSWLVKKFKKLLKIGKSIISAFKRFLKSLGVRDAFRLGKVWKRAKRIFTKPIKDFIKFIKSLVADILKFIREAILKPLAVLAARTPGWNLLIAVLGKNPITGETVLPKAEKLIGGFMKLIGQEEIWENIKKANAIERCWKWFKGNLKKLFILVKSLPTRFIETLKSLTIKDLVLVPLAFAKIFKVFASFTFDFISWAGSAMWELLKIIFEVVAPGAMPFLKKAEGAFKKILANPIGFLKNLVKAGKMGFYIFKNRIASILKEVLIDWLTGTMEGAAIYIPKAFEFKEILRFTLSVLGISWENIRAKLVKHFGEGPVVVLEQGFELIKILVKEGPAAAWEKIKEHLSTLKDTIIKEIISWVTTTVVTKAVIKIVSSLNPVGGFIQAILTIWGAIKVFIQRIHKIIEVGRAFLNSIIDIANGNLVPAAMKIVRTMKGILVLAVSFLAEFAGLGKISVALQNILKKIRDPIDKAIDKMVAWVAKKAKGFLKKKDNSKHGQIAKAASKDLKKGSGKSKGYAELRKAKVKQAKGIEQKYQGKLKKGIKIRFIFIDPTKDQKDKDLDFKVRIAPNATEVPDSIVTGQEELPKSEIKYSSENKGGDIMGTYMNAILLTKEGGKGTVPTQRKHTIFDKLLKRRLGGSSYYVRGHLLNHNVHGPGKWKNMTPLSKEGNRLHESGIESKVKAAVNSDPGKIVKYNVKPIYGRTALETPVEADPVIKEIRDAEQYVPKGLEVEADILKSKEDNFAKKQTLVSKTTIPNNINTKIDSYQITSSKKETVSLTGDTAKKIVENSGGNFTEEQISKIKNATESIQNLYRFDQIKEKFDKNDKIRDHIEKLRLMRNVKL